jgi:hypothetical protein
MYVRHVLHDCDHDARYAAVYARTRCTQLLKLVAVVSCRQLCIERVVAVMHYTYL